jgi:AcrR family transcriptional regulator
MTAAVKSRRAESVEATRDALLESARAHFAERGFAATSLDEVVSAARVTKGALYHHFPGGKLALFEAVYTAVDEELAARILAALPPGAGPWEVVEAGLDAFLEACADPVVQRVMFQEGPAALGWERWREVQACPCRTVLTAAVQGLVDAGALKPLPQGLLVQVLFTALGEAAMSIGAATDQAAATADARRLLLDLLGGLRA